MKKFLVSMAVIWSAVGLGLFFAWWTISRNLTPAEVTDHANKIAKELQIPWVLKFNKVQPRFGGDFRLVFKGITATNADGVQILIGHETDVRLPWTMFFTRNPGQVNVTIDGVKIADWKVLLTEVEKWLDARRVDSTQEISLPPHVVASRFNLRMMNIEGKLNGVDRKLDKLFLLNMNPRNPSAFEVVLPWSLDWRDAAISGVTKILGEYRISQDKIDLHYYLKNRVQLTRGSHTRTGENSIEGKGFYHPRMGLLSTLTSKDDWLALIGDVEWTKDHIKVNVPKFAISHELLLDLLPFDGIRSGSGPYQGSSAGGSLQWMRTAGDRSFSVGLRTKSSLKIARPEGDRKLEVKADWSTTNKATASITLADASLFDFSGTSKGAALSWDPSLFVPPAGEPNWLWPDVGVWDLLSWFPWSTVMVTNQGRTAYKLERAGADIRVEGYTPWSDGPRMTLVYPVLSGKIAEWVAEFSAQPIEKMFALVGIESPVVTGFAFSGGMQLKTDGRLTMKLAWKGPPLALLARSSCKVVIQDNPELSPVLNENFSHQAELSYVNSTFEVKRWTMRSATATWEAKGTWANEPIKCSLQLVENQKKKKPRTFEVQLN